MQHTQSDLGPSAGDDSGPLLDIRDRGIGDVVVACWLAHAAQAAGRAIRINPRGLDSVCTLLGVGPPVVTEVEADNWARTDGLGHRHEYARVAAGAPLTRFAAWADSLGMPELEPRRPPYVEAAEDAAWAEEEWRQSAGDGQLRIALFPEAAWLIRRWPAAYFVDLATMLKAHGVAVVMVGAGKELVSEMGSRWYAGFSLARTAALLARADAVVANDSGPAHLAGTIGTPTFVVAGPTDGGLVFAHDPNVQCIGLPAGDLECHPCHFAAVRGYRDACKVGGCRALMTLTPEPVLARMWPQIARRAGTAAR